MGRVVKDEKELAQAIKNNVDYIEVEGGIKDFFIKVTGTAQIALTFSIGRQAITTATNTYISTKKYGDIKKTAVAAISATAAAGILGPTTAATCVMMAVAAGGVDVLNKLREYRIEEQGGRLFLVK